MDVIASHSQPAVLVSIPTILRESIVQFWHEYLLSQTS